MPAIPPKSLQFTPEQIPAPVKARVHLHKSEDVKEPHFKYLEAWRGFEFLYREGATATQKALDSRAGPRSATEMDVIADAITALPRPRVENILAMKELPELNAALCRKNMKRILGDNELLCELGVDEAQWQLARKELQFNLKANYWRAAGAVARLLLIVRGACDPKVRKTDNLVSETAILASAYEILRYVIKHIVENAGEAHETFMGVNQRLDKAQKAQQALLARAKKA